MTPPLLQFRHCPRCGSASYRIEGTSFACEKCQFLYFFNPAAAAGAFLKHARKGWLFIRRARDPARHKLALPGGFIEVGETAEAGLRREIFEEVGVTVPKLTYLCSQPNSYGYREILYPVLDLFYIGRISRASAIRPLEDVAEIEWVQTLDVDPAEIAFPSIRAAVEILRQRYLDDFGR
jgi:ADP-ribose pyrophosphatase YjhB (NUDIX family)